MPWRLRRLETTLQQHRNRLAKKLQSASCPAGIKPGLCVCCVLAFEQFEQFDVLANILLQLNNCLKNIVVVGCWLLVVLVVLVVLMV